MAVVEAIAFEKKLKLETFRVYLQKNGKVKF